MLFSGGQLSAYLSKARQVGRIEFESDEPAVVLNKLDLLAKDGVHLLNAGAVLFCNSPMTDVQMAKFATNVKGAFTDIPPCGQRLHYPSQQSLRAVYY